MIVLYIPVLKGYGLCSWKCGECNANCERRQSDDQRRPHQGYE